MGQSWLNKGYNNQQKIWFLYTQLKSLSSVICFQATPTALLSVSCAAAATLVLCASYTLQSF